MDEPDEFEAAENAIIEWIMQDGLWEDGEPPPKPKRTRVRYEMADCYDTEWGRLIRSKEVRDASTRQGKKFRRRFRVPFPLYWDHIVVICKEKKIFNKIRNSRIPVEFKVLIC